MLSNAYFLAKFRFDTAENKPAKNLQIFGGTPNQADAEPGRTALSRETSRADGRRRRPEPRGSQRSARSAAAPPTAGGGAVPASNFVSHFFQIYKF